MRFLFPKNISWDVYRILAGSYDVSQVDIKGRPTVLDIGANVGAFSAWALRRWPGCRVIAYEPYEAACRYFRANNPDVELIQKAVWPEPTMKLYLGKKFMTTHSPRPTYRESFEAEPVEVEAVHPRDLPRCDVLKVDTEGAEVPILTHYLNFYQPILILVETHSDEDRHEVERLCQNYWLVGGEILNKDLAELKFARNPENS